MKIQLKRSNVLEGGKAKEPTSAQMEYGELAVNYSNSDPSLFIKDSTDNIVKIADTTPPGDGTITIKQPGSPDQSFTVNQDGDTEINLLNDNTQVTPGDGSLLIESFGSGDTSTGSYTANQTAQGTLTLPQISYTDLKDKPSIPTPGAGVITIKQPGTADQSFNVNQSGPTEINLKNDNTVVTPGAGVITIKQPGVSDQSFNVNQSGATEINLKNDDTIVTPGNGALSIQSFGSGDTSTGTFTANQSGTGTLTLPQISYGDLKDVPPAGAAPGNGTITIKQPGTVDQSFTVNQTGNTEINLKNDNTQVTPGNGALTIKTAGEGANATGTFTANQSGAGTLTLPAIRYNDLSGAPNNNALYLSKTGPDTAAGKIQFNAGYSLPLTNNGKMSVSTTGKLVTYESDLEPAQHRFDMDEASRVSTGYKDPGSTWIPTVIINTAPSANSNVQVNRYYSNTGGSQAFAKGLQINCRAANVNLSGGTTNGNNTPGGASVGFAFTQATRATRFSFYNIAQCLSSTPTFISNIDQFAAYYVNSTAFGYNDGTTDISLQNTIIKGYDSNLTKDGSCGGATKVWSNYHVGDAPNYYAGFIRAAAGVDFSNSTTDFNANEEETLSRYERGTYTPELTGSATAVSYSQQAGSYQIIGNVCTAVVEMTYSGASGTNQISITLPVISKSYGTNLNAISSSISFHNANVEIASPPLSTTVGDGQTVALLIRGGSRTQNYNSSRVKYDTITNAQVRFSITYTV